MVKKIGGKLRHLYYCFLTLLSPTLNTKARFRSTYGKKLNLKNPRTFNEKGMWLKLNRYNHDREVADCADKYTAREYVRARGCEELLSELIAVYDRVEDIDFDALPDAFVIKWNFGCGYNLICPDKSKLDVAAAKRKLKKWGRKKYHLHFSEMQYQNRPKKLLVEAFIKTENGSLPVDYKVYCFDGKAEYVMICLEREEGKPKCYFFDRDWNFKRFRKENPAEFTFEKPVNLAEMLRYAEVLSEGFPFVRVDFFSCDHRLIFGEMTFTPAGYLNASYTDEAERILGERLRV